jgi:hypothetical protein
MNCDKIIKAKSDWTNVTKFINGYASFVEDREWGLINKKGETIIRNKYNSPLLFFNGLASIRDDGKIGFINTDRDEIIEPDFEDIALPFIKNNAIVKDGNDYIFINKKGKTINKNEYEVVDKSIINNLIKYQNIIDFNQTLETDYFDADYIADVIIQSISYEEINGISKGMNVEEVLKILNLGKNILPQNNRSDYIRISSKEINQDCSYSMEIYFDADVSEAITETYRRRSSWGNYMDTRIIGYEPNKNAKIEYITYSISLRNRIKDKEKNLGEKIKIIIESNEMNFISEISNDQYYYFGTNQDSIKTVVKIRNNSILFAYAFEFGAFD